jgi:hypothetical protein
MEDFLLTPKAEAERKQALASAMESSNVALRSFLHTHAPGVPGTHLSDDHLI